MTSYDAIVIGAGHNGLTAAVTLAKSGRRVLLVEAAHEPGGMARNVELATGFRQSRVAHVLNRLNPEVIETLELVKHGLTLHTSAVPTVCLSDNGDHLVMQGAYGEKSDGLTADDASAWRELRERLLLQSTLLKRFINSTPIQPGAVEWSTRILAAKTALKLKLAGAEELRQFLRMALMCVADVADEALTDDRLKGLLSFDATLGIHLGPRSPTSLLGLYYRLTGEADGQPGAQVVPEGGMGAVIEAFQRASESAGVTLRTGCEVRKVLVDNGRAVGVSTTQGEEIHAPCVVSAISPVTTFLTLVGPRELDTGFVRDIRSIRTRGNVSRLNLALDRPPEINGLRANLRSARMVYAPSIDHVERAFNPTKYGELSEALCFELIVPSESDAASAPAGAATASISVQNTPYDLKAGWSKASKKQLRKSLIRQLERLAPGIGNSIVASELLTPVDIESEYLAPGGHWHHGELQIDRMYSLRPVFGAANYRGPLVGLYICGAGTHPGGGMCGASGLNAARQVIADTKEA